MMKNALHSNIISYTTRLVQCVEEVAFEFDPDNIHELRTTYKKIRALLRWQKAGKKSYKEFKNMYDVAGELRNIQVAKEMIKKEKDVPLMFNHWLSYRLIALKKEWEKACDEKILQRFRKNIKSLEITPIKNKEFVTKRVKAISDLRDINPLTDIAIHDIRKMTKDLQYVLEWWDKHQEGLEPLTKDISITQLKKMGERIGIYNDKRMLLLLFIGYAQQEKDPILIDQINLVMDKWQQEKIFQKENLIGWLRSVNLETDEKNDEG